MTRRKTGGSGRKNCLEEEDVESAVPVETAADARPQVHRKEKWNFLSRSLESMCTGSGTV